MNGIPIRRWRIIALFFVHALALGAIHTRIPDLQLLLGLSEAQLGFVLMGQPIGGLGSFLFSSQIIERFGPRRVILALMPVVTIGAALITIVPNGGAMFTLMVLNGICFSLTNVAINVEADRVEAATDSRVMNTCHGAWSVGFLLTSLLGAALRGLGVSPAIHLWLLAPMVIGLVLLIVVPMPITVAQQHVGDPKKRFAWPTPATMGLVAFGLGAALAEGASRAWSIIYLRDSFEVAAWLESMALPALLVTMAIGRLMADRWIDRFGPVRVARVLAVIAIAGITLVVLAPNAGLALAGFGLVGVGICVLYPLTVSAAARIGDRPASQNVAATTLIFQFVNLGAPVLIGVVAQGLGIVVAFAMLLPLLVMTWLMAGKLAPSTPSPRAA